MLYLPKEPPGICNFSLLRCSYVFGICAVPAHTPRTGDLFATLLPDHFAALI